MAPMEICWMTPSVMCVIYFGTVLCDLKFVCWETSMWISCRTSLVTRGGLRAAGRATTSISVRSWQPFVPSTASAPLSQATA
eukprot:4381343-Alexandrium_andersonii.AAC.1